MRLFLALCFLIGPAFATAQTVTFKKLNFEALAKGKWCGDNPQARCDVYVLSGVRDERGRGMDDLVLVPLQDGQTAASGSASKHLMLLNFMDILLNGTAQNKVSISKIVADVKLQVHSTKDVLVSDMTGDDTQLGASSKVKVATATLSVEILDANGGHTADSVEFGIPTTAAVP